MKAGKLRHKVTFEARSTDEDAIGARLETWTAITTPRRCSIRPLMGKEATAQDAVEFSRVTDEIRLRYDDALSTLKPYDRAVDYSKSPAAIYDIKSVLNVHERDRELVLRCERDGAR